MLPTTKRVRAFLPAEPDATACFALSLQAFMLVFAVVLASDYPCPRCAGHHYSRRYKLSRSLKVGCKDFKKFVVYTFRKAVTG